MRRTHLAGAMLAAVLLTGPAIAAELIDRGYYDGWNVMVDPDLGNGCLIQSVRDGETLVRIGYDGLKDQGYLAVFNRDWTRIRADKTYDLTFDLDGRQFPANVTGLKFGKVPGAGVTFRQGAVFDEIARARTMIVLDDAGQALLQVDLNGTSEAIAQARACQDEMG